MIFHFNAFYLFVVNMMVNDEFLYLYQQLITHKTKSTKNKLIKQNKNPESEQTQICKSELNISMDFCASRERTKLTWDAETGNENFEDEPTLIQPHFRIQNTISN